MTRIQNLRRIDWGSTLMAVGLMGLSLVAMGLQVGCAPPPPASDAADLDDAQADGFLDVMPPDNIAFQPATNVKVAVISEVDDSDIATIAELEGVPDEYVSLLPLVDIVASVDLTLTFDDGTTDVYSDSVVVGPFERSLEFACPQRVDMSAQADVYLPLGEVQTLVQGVSASLFEGTDFECGETLRFVVSVDDAGVLHVEETDDTSIASADSGSF